MSELTSNLNTILHIKSDIRDAIESKGVDMTGLSFGDYATAIGSISGGGQFVTESLSVTENGTYTPGTGVDGFSTVTVSVPQTVSGDYQKNLTEGIDYSYSILSNSASYVGLGRFSQVSYTSNNIITYKYNFTEVHLPNCINVYQYAFCKNYMNFVDLPNCKFIHFGAFSECNFRSISLPECESIGPWAFYYNSNSFFRSILLPQCVYIGNMAFKNCLYLQTVSLPKCEIISGETFMDCNSLSSISLPACKIIGPWAFNYTNLSSLSLPACELIEEGAFDQTLTELYLNNSSVTSLVYNNDVYLSPFRDNLINSNLQIYVDASIYTDYVYGIWSSWSSYFVKSDYYLYSNVLYGVASTIDSTVFTTLGINKSDITGVDMNTLETVASGAFKDCINLSSINIPNVGVYNDEIFANTGFTSFNISVSQLGNSVFANCSSLSEVYVYGDNITVGSDIFSGCSALTSIYIQDSYYFTAPNWSEYSSLMVYDKIELSFSDGLLYGNILSIDSASWTDLGVTSNQIISVSLANCEVIGESTFYSCTSLSYVSLPKVKYIYASAFRQCRNLQYIELPECTNLNISTFAGCSSLSYVSLPKVVELSSTVFNTCVGLTSIYLPECGILWASTFTGCNKLSVIVLPKCSVIYSRALRVMNNNSSNKVSLYLGYSDGICQLSTSQPSMMFFSNNYKDIYVPASLINAYENDSMWSSVTNKTWYRYEDTPYYSE